jgi:benzoate-CoA ligase family protein
MKTLHIEHDNLASRLLDEAVARGWGDRIALREGARTLTYHQLRDQAARTAAALRTLRIERGDRVAILMPDTLEAAVALFGALYHGAVAVPLSELARASDIADLLNDSGATAIVVHSSLRGELEEMGSAVPSLREVLAVGGRGPGQRDFVSLVRGAAPAAEPAEVDPDGTAILLYSAGAHGEQEEGGAASRRRGVPHTHATPLRAFESLCRGPVPLGEADRVLSVVRLWTAYGIGAGLLFPLAAGAESLLLPEQPHSRAIFAAVESFKPSALFATPSVYGQLARDAEVRGLDRPLASVRVCVSGAEDMPSRISDKVRQILGAEVTVSYGLTEAFQFVLCGPATLRPGACGQPVPGFDVRVVNDAGEEIGADEIGTLEIRGPTVAAGYWNESRSTLRQGWFKTRDRFLVDRDGNYYHCGRADDLFKVGGKWVSPTEVEQALIAHEAVWECAVVGADDEDGLIKPLAFVVPNIGHEPGPDLEKELREYVKKELAPYKYPRWIDFLSELPKGPHGKVLRYKLRDRVRSSGRARRAETANS